MAIDFGDFVGLVLVLVAEGRIVGGGSVSVSEGTSEVNSNRRSSGFVLSTFLIARIVDDRLCGCECN